MAQQERAVRTRQALIRSAAAVFDSHGYAEATLGLISAGAGVSPGALHFHFANKAVIGAAVERAAAGTLRDIAGQAASGRGPALQALIDASHLLARTLASDVVMRAGLQLCREARYEPSGDLRDAWPRHVRRRLAVAADEGTLLPGLGLHRAAALIVAATTGFQVLGKDDPEWISGRSLTDFWEMALPCLATAATVRRLEPRGTFHVGEEGPGCRGRDAVLCAGRAG